MKATLILAAACALITSAASAQTVAPGTTPGAQTGNPSNMPSAGSPTTDQQAPDSKRSMSSSDRSNKKMMRKSGKMKTNADGSMKTKSKM
ncbi:MAG: hypothetical protein ACRYFR_00785 [Janthinobacterium lividum]